MKYTLALRRLFLSFAAVSFLSLYGCGSTQPAPSATQQVNTLPSDEALRYEQLAEQASDESQRTVYQYLAGLAWYEQGFEDRAYFLLRNLDPAMLSPEQRLNSHLTLSDFYRKRGQLAVALEHLEDEQLQSDLILVNNNLKGKWASATGYLSTLLGEYEQSFRVYDFALSYSPDEEQDSLRAGLWKSLTLIDNLPQPPFLSGETGGWVALADINNQSSGTVSDQYLAYLLWQDQYYGHPAHTKPPASFAALEKIAAADRPRVALLLPLTGNLAAAGNAILDGYMAARASEYQSAGLSPLDPLAPTEIKIFDTEANSITQIARELSDQEFDLIIGPLDKTRVATYVETMPETPSLVLNTLPEGRDLSEKPVLGLSLNVESESIQAAIKALQDGHQSAIALVPNSFWGDRAGLAFSDFWKAEAGDILEFSSYADSTTHADLLEQDLHVNESNKRKQGLQQLLGKNIEFTPRRRQDIDALFLAASPAQARQLKPMLAFFFAEDIPVYSTSNIYSGVPDSKADRDLDGIQFSTLPWILDRNHDLRKLIEQQGKPNTTELKMQAIGVDTYYLSQRLPQLLEAPDTVYRGVLGKLARDPESNDLERKQVWATFSNGLAHPLAN